MKPTRRWLQFSLRSFLVFLTALTVWLGVLVNRAREQREAVETIESLGAEVAYDWQLDGTSIEDWVRKVNGAAPGPRWLRQVIGDDFFQSVVVAGFILEPKTDSVVLKCLPSLQRLKSLKAVVVCPSNSVSKSTEDKLKAGLPGCEVRLVPIYE